MLAVFIQAIRVSSYDLSKYSDLFNILRLIPSAVFCFFAVMLYLPLKTQTLEMYARSERRNVTEEMFPNMSAQVIAGLVCGVRQMYESRHSTMRGSAYTK